MKRREALAGVATTVGVAVTGATTWLFTRGNDGDERGAQSTPKSGQNETGNSTPKNETAPRASKEDVESEGGGGNETEEQPEAAEPPTDPEAAPDESEYADPEEVQASQPTAEDVAISNTNVTKSENGTTVTGSLMNESGDTIGSVDVEVTFYLEDGSTTTAMWGTNNLADGESWDFEVTGNVPYESVTKCDVRPIL